MQRLCLVFPKLKSVDPPVSVFHQMEPSGWDKGGEVKEEERIWLLQLQQDRASDRASARSCVHYCGRLSVFGELNWELVADEGGSLSSNHHPQQC